MRTIELHFPIEGINRRMPERPKQKRGSYSCPWAVNVCNEDNIERRLRGGSRVGLTKFVANDLGTTISDLASINLSSESGSTEVLFALVDSSIKTVTGGVFATPVAYLGETPDDPSDAADLLTDDAGNNILVSSVAAPSSGFLVSGQQTVLAVTASSVIRFNPKTGQTDLIVASAGTVPTGATFGAVYRDRLIVSGGDNAIYASKMGDYSNWDYGRDISDGSRAIVWQLALSSDVGLAPTAMISHKDSSLMIASKTTLWVLRGDPASGQLQRVSDNIGIVSSKAWCKSDDTIFFLSDCGVYKVGADGSGLAMVSENSLPAELDDINTSTTTVLMEYEQERKMIHVYLKTAGGNDTHWVYELQTEAWWAVRLQNDHSPVAVCKHKGEVILGGNDGYVRKVGGSDDDGTAIQSHVIMGAMRLGSVDRSGIINMLHGALGTGSGTVTWRVVVGASAEEASDNAKLAIEAFQAGGDYSGYVKHTDTWSAGRSLAQYPRVSSLWCCIWLQSTDRWSFEGASMQLKLSGRYR